MSAEKEEHAEKLASGAAITEGLIAAWLRSNTHQRALLGAIDLTALLLTPRPRARSIGAIFAHVVSVRLRRVGVIGGETMLEEIEPLAKGDEESRDALDAALATSADLVARLVRERLESGEPLRGFSGGVPAFLSYLIAHDAHHRGQVLAILSKEKIRVADEITYGIWDWS